MFFKKNKPAPQAGQKAAPSAQPMPQGHSLFAPAINPVSNTVIDFGFGRPKSGHPTQAEPASPSTYESYQPTAYPPAQESTAFPEPMPWETPLDLPETAQAPTAYSMPEPAYTEPVAPAVPTFEPEIHTWDASPAAPAYEDPSLGSHIPAITPDMSPEAAWALMEPNFPQQPAPDATEFNPTDTSQPYLQETFENYTPAITQANEPENLWPAEPSAIAFTTDTDPNATADLMAFEMPASESMIQSNTQSDFSAAYSPPFEDPFTASLGSPGPEFEPSYNAEDLPDFTGQASHFSEPAASELETWMPPTEALLSEPSELTEPTGTAYFPQEPAVLPLEDFSWGAPESIEQVPSEPGAREIGTLPAFEPVPLEPGAFLDSVNQQLYPPDPFHSPNSELGMSEQAFEEAAQYLFPETVSAPLEWTDEAELEAPTQSATWDDELEFGGESLDLGSSVQANAEGLNDISTLFASGGQPAPAEPEFLPQSGLDADLSLLIPSPTNISEQSDYSTSFGETDSEDFFSHDWQPESATNTTQPASIHGSEISPMQEFAYGAGSFQETQPADAINDFEALAAVNTFNPAEFTLESLPTMVSAEGYTDLNSPLEESEPGEFEPGQFEPSAFDPSPPVENSAFGAAETWQPSTELLLDEPEGYYSPQQSTPQAHHEASEFPPIAAEPVPEFSPATDNTNLTDTIPSIAGVDGITSLNFEEDLYAIEANLSFTQEESQPSHAVDNLEYAPGDTWFTETPETAINLAQTEPITTATDWDSFATETTLPNEEAAAPASQSFTSSSTEDDDFYATSFTLNEQGELVPESSSQQTTPTAATFETSEISSAWEASSSAIHASVQSVQSVQEEDLLTFSFEEETTEFSPQSAFQSDLEPGFSQNISPTEPMISADIESKSEPWDFEVSEPLPSPQDTEADFFQPLEAAGPALAAASATGFIQQSMEVAPPAYEIPPSSVETASPTAESSPAAPAKLPPTPPPSRFDFKPKVQFSRPAPKPEVATPVSSDELEAQWLSPPPIAKQAAPKPYTPPVEELMLGNLEVISICPLSNEKRLLVVQSNDIFALMGQSGQEQPQISVLKIFEYNPIAYQNTFTAVEEAQAAAQGMYVVQVGTWHAIISTFQDKITLHTELG
ncbi:MAG: hypothetical protein K0Q50_1633 [Vampirovibrio sp.]|jgi:hypothetical protein|nr:hypothetical protein [Vampirovibrio sp.]